MYNEKIIVHNLTNEPIKLKKNNGIGLISKAEKAYDMEFKATEEIDN